MWRQPVFRRVGLGDDPAVPGPPGRQNPGDKDLNITRRGALGATAAALASAVLPVRAAGYPDKPVKIAVGFAAGGGADIIARIVGTQMGMQTHESFVVDNKAGATGTIAAT